MKLKGKFYFWLLLFVSSTSMIFAQDPANRYEIITTDKDPEIFPITLGNKGIANLVHLDRNFFSLEKLNTDFKLNWRKTAEIEKNLDFVRHSYDGKYISLLFSRYKTNYYLVFRFNVETGDYVRYDIYSVDRMEISNFEVLNNSVFIGGIVNQEPVILFTDLNMKKTFLLPSVVRKNAEIQSMELDTKQELIYVTYSLGNKPKNYQLVVRSFDETGTQIGQVVMEPSDQYALMNAKTTQINDSLQLIVGTYGHKSTIGSNKGPTSQGMYFNSLVDGQPKNSKIYSFTSFENFFNFLPEKEKNRKEKKIQNKAEKGEDLRLDYRMILHNVIQRDGKFIVIGEAFYPQYQYNNYGPYGNSFFSPFGFGLSPFSLYNPFIPLSNPFFWGYGYYGLYSPFSSYYSPFGYRSYGGNSANGQFNGWVYTHAIIAEFDENGNLLWDKCIGLKNSVEPVLKEKVVVNFDNKDIYLSYNTDNSIITLKIVQDDNYEMISSQPIFDETKIGRIRRQDKPSLTHWYGKNYIASGVQTLVDGEGKRSVFYLNKIEID